MTTDVRNERLRDHTALVTGAAGILGATFCRALSDAGCRVIGVDMDADAVQRAAGSGVEAMAVDLRSEEAIVEAVARVEQQFGIPDVVVNNAASKSSKVRDFFLPFERASGLVWDEVMAVNVRAPMLLCREIGRRLVDARRPGSVVNIASIYGVVAPDQRIYEGSDYPELGGAISSPAIYSASKAAVLGLTKYLAAYWGQAGIRVNAISPGGVASGQNETFATRYSARVPLGRMARREDLCGALLYLASDESSYVTGQNIIVDGGLSAW